MLRSFFLPTALFTNTSPSSSTSIQSGADVRRSHPRSSVTRCAKFLAFNRSISRCVEVLARQLSFFGCSASRRPRSRSCIVRDGRGRAGERIDTRLGLGERDHVSDRLLAGQHHHEPVDPRRDARVRGDAVPERRDQVPELLIDLLGRQPQRLEHLALQVGAMDTDAAAAQLEPVQDDVVRPRLRGLRSQVVGQRSGERMVLRRPALILIAPLEQRRLGHPQVLPLALAHQLQPGRHRAAESIERHRHAIGAVRDDQHQVARRLRRWPRARRRSRPPTGASRPASARRSSSTTIHTRPAAPRPLVSVTSWSSSLRESCAPPGAAIPWIRPPDVTTDANALNPVPANTSFRSASSIPYRRSGLSDPYRSITSLKGEPRERRRDLHAVDLADELREQRLHQRVDVLLVDERHLEVELRELEATVGA